VLRSSGEEYRNYLRRLVEKNNLREHVYFHNRFVSAPELFEYLSAIDIYITPYLNEAQITSGTLAYAVGAGAGCNLYALLARAGAPGRGEGEGSLIFHDSKALVGILNELLDNPSTLLEFRHKAYTYGRQMTWPVIGEKYADLMFDVAQSYSEVSAREDAIVDPLRSSPLRSGPRHAAHRRYRYYPACEL